MEEIQKIMNYKSSALKWKIGIGAVVLLLGVGGYFFFFQQKAQESYTYVSEPLKRGDLTMIVSATGNIEPVETVQVGTEVSGTIEKVYADYNDVVKKGQLLARLDKTKYQSTLDRAKASLAAAKASLENMEAAFFKADATVSRNKTLREATKGALPSRSDWDNDWASFLAAKAQVSNAKAQIKQAEYTLVSSQYDLDRTVIYSPIDGIILTRNIDPGQTVAASFTTPVLFEIANDLTKMELQASVDEADIAKVKAGQTATFSVDAYPDKTFEAHIKLVRVNSEIVDSVVTYKAVLEVDNKELLLKPGMSADADIITETFADTLIVSKATLLFIPIKSKKKAMFGGGDKEKITIDSKPHVWVLENGQPKKVYVKVLGSNGSETAIVSEGLKAGDPIIVSKEKAK
jgi:HlyD family secretion protein